MRLLSVFIVLGLFITDSLAFCLLGFVGGCDQKCRKFDHGDLGWAVRAYQDKKCGSFTYLSQAGDYSVPCTRISVKWSEPDIKSVYYHNAKGCHVSFYWHSKCQGKNLLGEKKEGWHEKTFAGWDKGKKARNAPNYYKVDCESDDWTRVIGPAR
jgi:hypothetical protein